MEREQVLIIFGCKVFLEYGLDERLDAHLDICFISAAMACLSSLIADSPVAVVGLLSCFPQWDTRIKFGPV